MKVEEGVGGINGDGKDKTRKIKFIYVAVVSEGESTGQMDTLFFLLEVQFPHNGMFAHPLPIPSASASPFKDKQYD